MPDPDKLLNTIARAIDAVRDTPGRAGRVVEFADAEDVLIAGDLHGQVGHLQTILKIADMANHPRRHLVIQELIHGPYSYPDGSDKSHQMVDLFCALKCQYPERVHYLMGNHEMSQWIGRKIAKGDVELNRSFAEGVDTAYGGQGRRIYEAYMRLFAELPLALRTPNRVLLTHSLPSTRKFPAFPMDRLKADPPEREEYENGGAASALVWGRDVSAANAEVFLHAVDADLLVTGHVPCEEGYMIPNARQVILDCGRSPAAVCLFPATGEITHEKLKEGLRML